MGRGWKQTKTFEKYGEKVEAWKSLQTFNKELLSIKYLKQN